MVALCGRGPVLLGRVQKSRGKAEKTDRGAALNLKYAKEASSSSSCSAARTVDIIYQLAEMSRQQEANVPETKQSEPRNVQQSQTNDVTGLAKQLYALQVETPPGQLGSSVPASAAAKTTLALDRLRAQGDSVLMSIPETCSEHQLNRHDETGLARQVPPSQVGIPLRQLGSSGPLFATAKPYPRLALNRLRAHCDSVLKSMEELQAQSQAEGLPRAFRGNTNLKDLRSTAPWTTVGQPGFYGWSQGSGYDLFAQNAWMARLNEHSLWEDYTGGNPEAWNSAWLESWEADADNRSLAMTAASVAAAALPKLELKADLRDMDPVYVILPGMKGL